MTQAPPPRRPRTAPPPVPGVDRTLVLDRALRVVLSTESRGAVALLIATAAALLWVTLNPASYDSVWHTELAFRLGGVELVEDLRGWVNDGLMVLFFFIVGLEVRREFERGEMRDRHSAITPTVAALAGLVVPAVLFLAIVRGGPGSEAWGVVISTDTAFALGLLALLGPKCGTGLRIFLLTLAVVDDIGAVLVIAIFYTDDLHLDALAVAVAVFALAVLMSRLQFWRGPLFLVLGVVAFVAVLESGVHPTILGVLYGLFAKAAPAPVTNLERLTELAEQVRLQPDAQNARLAKLAADSTVSANDRMQYLWRPVTTLVIVPLFALANAGVPLTSEVITRAAGSALTLGVVVGLVVGKTFGIAGAIWLVVRLGWGSLPSGTTHLQLLAVSAVAGIGFTISLFIADLGLPDEQLRQEAQVGILAASTIAALLGWALFQISARVQQRPLSAPSRLTPAVDLVGTPARDHVQGPVDAPVTLVEFGDVECPYTAAAAPVVYRLTDRFGDDLAFVWRHLPLTDSHPHAQRAALAVEAAAVQDAFWPMRDRLLRTQDRLEDDDLVAAAAAIGLDVDRFVRDLDDPAVAARVAADVASAQASGVEGTPTFFISGVRYDGRAAELGDAVEDALARVRLAASGQAMESGDRGRGG